MKTAFGILFFLVFFCFAAGVGISSEVGKEGPSAEEAVPANTGANNYSNEKYSVAELNRITTPDGRSGYCHDIFNNMENMKKICQDYYVKEKNEYEECLAKKVKGTETEASLKAIDKICYRKSNSTAWKFIAWYLEETRFENYYASGPQESN